MRLSRGPTDAVSCPFPRCVCSSLCFLESRVAPPAAVGLTAATWFLASAQLAQLKAFLADKFFLNCSQSPHRSSRVPRTKPWIVLYPTARPPWLACPCTTGLSRTAWTSTRRPSMVQTSANLGRPSLKSTTETIPIVMENLWYACSLAAKSQDRGLTLFS